MCLWVPNFEAKPYKQYQGILSNTFIFAVGLLRLVGAEFHMQIDSQTEIIIDNIHICSYFDYGKNILQLDLVPNLKNETISTYKLNVITISINATRRPFHFM
jgi:hypothetical protein